MSRLTEKNKFDTHYGISISKNLLQSAYDKLGQLEDLEEELGCPLEVLVKLAKQEKINIKGLMKSYYVFYNLSTNRFEIRDEENMELYPLKDYKTLFWLREDKSE